MPALRCSVCGINYPSQFQHQKCRVCEGPTEPFSNLTFDVDWQKKVDTAQKDMASPVDPAAVALDKVLLWREEMLLAAGFSDGSAAEIAANQLLDLHKAVELAAKAGPELAYRILT